MIAVKIVEESNKIISAIDQATFKHNELKTILDQILEKEEEAYKIQQQVSQNQIRNDALDKQIKAKEDKISNISAGTANIDKEIGKLSALEEQLIDGILYAFQEQTTEDLVMLNGFGTIVNSLAKRVKPYLPQVRNINCHWSCKNLKLSCS